MISLPKLRIKKNELVIKEPTHFSLFVVPTWSCTLRCPYCFVSKNLRKDFNNENINIDELIYFIKNYISKYKFSKPSSILFIGGEPLLNPDLIINVSNRVKEFGFKCKCTTNLAFDMNQKVIDAIKLLDNITVSIDGPPETHNINRKVFKSNENMLDENENTFWKSYKNLCIISKIKKNIFVQGGLDHWDRKTFDRFFYFMISAGINENNIKPGVLTWKGDKTRYNNQSPVKNPCCVFRYMERFTVTESGISSNYFDPNNSFLGKLTENIDIIANNFKNYILDNMPALHDDECNNCDLFNKCFGGCYGHHLGVKPSEKCNKEMLRKNINEKLNK